jgi:hypothetical protein
MTVVQSNELAAEDAIGIARQNEPGDQTHRRIATRGSICLLPGIIARHSRAVQPEGGGFGTADTSGG